MQTQRLKQHDIHVTSWLEDGKLAGRRIWQTGWKMATYTGEMANWLEAAYIIQCRNLNIDFAEVMQEGGQKNRATVEARVAMHKDVLPQEESATHCARCREEGNAPAYLETDGHLHILHRSGVIVHAGVRANRLHG